MAQSASPATIDAAYRTLCARLNARQARDPEGAAIARTALEEAYRTLSSDPLRRHYDARIATSAVRPTPEAAADERPWFARPAFVLLIVGVALAAGYGYYYRTQKERAELTRQMQEREVQLARARAEREEMERQTAQAEAERKRRIEEARYQIWVDQSRRESAAHARRYEYERARADQEAARQQRMEEMAKQREEAQARMRLEQDKQRLRSLEQQNYGYRRY